ncbi:hypothetical protein G8O24_20915 [Bradyrhizobium sp. INPA01-394B]|uniref:Uncharacterized protein n=1 Tax=Bradyrhizobium campsiandrae TaxID=1729892 RepID=A0ABR7U5P3_9BRAD|nr:hypothetical protein [Bradyrhizobium campsiandrae]MBC9879806.1 hypothetical protein [Bradyrhizobium campsiandrae]MBC9978861.1 hypothetical protein [Bradyrhizobium campsiandrae]
MAEYIVVTVPVVPATLQVLVLKLTSLDSANTDGELQVAALWFFARPGAAVNARKINRH